jgi:UDP-N-acetylglucosamine/UDP-N-acetylgalactosamine 4-epimerase
MLAFYIGGFEVGYKHIRFEEGTVFLVTGSAGFIGSNLVEAILQLGYRVKGLDNLSTGKRENIEEFINHQNYEFVEGDIRDFATCMKACEGIDYVLHQAAWGSVPRSIEMPGFYEEINIKGTLNMLEAARQNGVKKFIYASSSSVYGDEPNLPKIEGREGQLLSPYALTKMVDEEYGKLYTKLYGLDTYGLRYFNVFGRRQDPDGAYAAVIPRFIKLLIDNERPTINGDGKQSRDFTYIENVIEANLKACLASSEAAGHAYNIAYGGREYLIDIYDELCKALGKNIQPVFGPDRMGDIKHSHADISKAKEMLGYNPEWSFGRGITEAIEWYKTFIPRENSTNCRT